jgi:hypothetical protein
MSWHTLTDYYVYTYFDSNQNPYYVGMGKGNRVVQKHLYVSVPLFENIHITDKLTQQEAWNKEIELIALYGREDLGTGPLKNLTKGGPTQKSGWNQSPVAKEKISAGNKGKVRTSDQRQRYKKPKSKEHSEKIRQANIGRKDDGRYEKIKETMKLKRWYNNGVITKMFVPGTEEIGFLPGRAIKETRNVMA